MNLSRRSFLRLGLASGAAFYIPRKGRAQMGGMSGTTPALTAYADPLPIPPVAKSKVVGGRDTYNFTMVAAKAKFHKNLPETDVLTYVTSPSLANTMTTGFGPTILAKKNRAVRVTQTNNLPMEMDHAMSMEHHPAVHLHGALVLPGSDGHPSDGIPMGTSRVYDYPNRQRGCALWYHDHQHGTTGHNVYHGLAGLYILEDTSERSLRLPHGSCEVPLLLMDRTFDSNGQLVYELDTDTLTEGKHGDVVLVNGKIQPFFEVAARLYRFRVLNASNSRQYKLALNNGSPLIQIGTDGGLMQRPKSQTSITISPSERVDFIIDFTDALTTEIVLQNLLGEGRTINLMKFVVNRREKENAVIPAFLREWEELPEPVVKRDFTLNRQLIDGAQTWTINGYGFDSPGRLAQIPRPKLGSVEHWRFINPTPHPHPMHLHLVQFQVVNIEGEPTDSSEYGWKDTQVVNPGTELTIAVKFDGYTGKYVFHCHNLEHEDFSMMSEFEVQP